VVNDVSNNFWPYYEYSKFLETDNFVWHYQLIGKPGNPILLFIHGAGASSHSWASLIPKLQEFQILAVDLPGHRFSKIKKGIRPQHDIIVKDLVVLFDSIKIKPNVFVGHSIGAVIVLSLSNIYKGPLSSIVLINGALERFEGPAATIFPLMAKVFYASPLTKYWIRLFNSAEKSLRKFLSISGSNLTSKNIDYYLQLMTDEDHVTGTLAFISSWSIGDIEKKLEKIKVPTLFLAGMSDGIVNYKTSVRANKKAFNAKIKLFQNEGHLIHEVSSAKVAKEINSFCKKI
jgi:magnesium chelatase accessory protein